MPQRKQDEPQRIECTYCGESLTEEEVASPCKDEQGGVICDECHTNHYEFTCCYCQNLAPIEDNQGDIGCLILVPITCQGYAGMEITAGAYRIVQHPFYADPSVSHDGIIESAIELVTLNCRVEEMTPFWCGACRDPFGYLCRECTEKIGRLHPPRVQIAIGPQGEG